MLKECIICQMDSLPQRMKKFGIIEEKRKFLVNEIESEISEIDPENSYSPEITRNILEKLKIYSSVTDPYQKEKEQSNRELLSRYDEFLSRVNSSGNKFNAALRLAIAGNIIDFGPPQGFDVNETIEKVCSGIFAIDHSERLKTEIEKAKTILYLGDNCGEIVLDKLFIESIGHPNVWFAVRDKIVLNDATEKEAREVGIDKFAKIISNGDDAPSTLLHRVSNDFLKIYNSADVIISKGMGNFEGLINEEDPRLFFLLMIKCPEIGNIVGAKKGDFVVKQNQH